MTECLRLRFSAGDGDFRPNCDEHGKYEMKQCHNGENIKTTINVIKVHCAFFPRDNKIPKAIIE